MCSTNPDLHLRRHP